MSAEGKLTLAILSYNHEDLMQGCLSTIREALTGHEWSGDLQEVLILDNGSSPPFTTRCEVAEVAPWIRTIHLPQNQGNIGGENACFEEARGDWVLFTANDVRFHPGCIRQLWSARSYPRLGQVQPRLFQPNRELDHIGLWWCWPGYGIRIRPRSAQVSSPCIPIVPSTCYLMKKSVWREMGGFDESLGISHADVDMGLKLAKAGYLNWVCPSASATHLMGQTIAKSGQNLSPSYRSARRQIVHRHYRGLDQWSRLQAIQGLDWISRQWKGR